MNALHAMLYPELEGFAPGARRTALRRARRQPLDCAELAGLGLGVVAVALLTRHATAELAAVPLLALAAVPILWHRTRRALREELAAPGRAPAER